MNKLQPELGYDPKCKLYKRVNAQTKVMWWADYYLPYRIRMRRPVHSDLRQAKKLMRIKEMQLLKGEFDDKDLKKLAVLLPEEPNNHRLSIDEGLKHYFDVTSRLKSANTKYNDEKSITLYFSYFLDKGKVFMDQIQPIDIQYFVGKLDEKNKSEATIRHAVGSVRKVFNWLIDDVQLLQIKNPVRKGFKIPKKNGIVRDRLLERTELVKIFEAEKYLSKKSHNISPIDNVIKFLLFTGARIGEVLHLEWPDLNLENGTWEIKNKPECPTKHGLGWVPKWGKERTIVLTPEALNLLKRLPVLSTIGNVPVRNKAGKIIDKCSHPAQFVFPKKEVIHKGLNEQVIYSRCDSIQKSWNTLKHNAGIVDVQLKDIRTYFNHFLKSQCGFTTKEASAYLGNSEEVNNQHYSPISEEVLRTKIKQIAPE